MNKPPTWKILGGVATIAIAACALIFLNIIFSRVNLRADLTQDHLYSLSNGTRTILKELPRDVTIKYYTSQSSTDMPAMQKQYADRVADLLREYRSAGKGKVHLEIYRVKPDSDEEDWARKYGLAGQIANPMKRDEYFCGLVVLSGSKEKAMPYLSFRGEQQLEYDLTKTLFELTQTTKPKIGVISSLPVFGGPGGDPMAMMMRQPPEPKWMAIQALESFFDVVNLGATPGKIPEDVKMILAIHPKNLSPENLYTLDQFVMRGGRLMAFLDPMCLADRDSSMGNPMLAGMDTSSSLNALTQAWGVTMTEGRIVGDSQLATQLQIRQGRVDNVPVVLSMGRAQVSKDDVATAQLESVLMPMAGALELPEKPVDGIRIEPLLTTTEQGGTVQSFEAMSDIDTLLRALKPSGKIPTAIRLTGTFPSAFPDGPPAAATNQTGQASAPLPHLAKGEKESAVILVSDADMLSDGWTVSVQSLMGTTFVEPITDNLAMLINLSEQLNGSHALIGLRSRGSFARPFLKVREIQEQAKRRYQEEYDKTVAKIDEINTRIGELSQGRQDGNRIELNNSIAGEIKKAQNEMREMNIKRRDLEKQLRREVESMEFNIKAANLLVVPTLLIIFGIVRGVQRRRRSNSPT